jgi:hypothetical protein
MRRAYKDSGEILRVVTQTFAGDLAAIGAPTSERWSRPTFRVAVDHDFAKDVLGYVSSEHSSQ